MEEKSGDRAEARRSGGFRGEGRGELEKGEEREGEKGQKGLGFN